MNTLFYVGMVIMLLSFMGLLGLGGLAGLLISVASDGRGMTWAAFKEWLPTFLALVAFLVMVGLLAYVVVRIMQYYGG
jgi:hypothetical protein